MGENKKEPSDYQVFIKEKHERLFNTSDEIINSAIKKATGLEVVSKERIIKGEANEVYSVKTETGQKFIIRISHLSHSENYFERERLAIELCAAKNIPVPKVLLIDYKHDGDKKLTICVEEKIPGIPMNEIEGLLDAENVAVLRKLLNQAGKLLSQIHSVDVNKFGGLLDKNDSAKYDSFEEVFGDKYIDREVMLEAAQTVSLNPEIIEKAIKIMRERSVLYPNVVPKLIHNDFGPKHLLIQDAKITGIIDLENAEGGDPVREFARWEFYFGDKYPIEYLKEGYADKSLFGPDFVNRLKLWKIYIGLSTLRYYIDEKNSIGIELAKKRLAEDIKYFE